MWVLLKCYIVYNSGNGILKFDIIIYFINKEEAPLYELMTERTELHAE